MKHFEQWLYMWFQWASFPTLNALTERAKLHAEAWGRTFAMGWSDDFICHFLPKWSKVWPAWLQLELHVFSIFPEVLYVLSRCTSFWRWFVHVKSSLIPLGGDYISGLCLRTSSTICLWQFPRTSGTIWGSVICKLHDPPSLPCRLRWTSFIQHMVNKFSFRKSFIPHLNHNTLVYNQGDLSLKKMSSVVGHSVLRNMLYDHARKFASRNWIPLNKTFYLEKNDYFEKEDSIISLVFCCYPYDKITLSA